MNGLEKHQELIAANQVDYSTLLPLFYNFEFSGLPFECRVQMHEDDNSIVVNLTAILGHLPYSAENKSQREMLLKQLGPLMARGIIIIDHHCKLTLPLKTIIKAELSAKILMETILYTLLDVQDALDVINTALHTPGTRDNKKQPA